jgi:hypothetical protein
MHLEYPWYIIIEINSPPGETRLILAACSSALVLPDVVVPDLFQPGARVQEETIML